MEKQRELYFNPNGEDQWLELNLDKRKIKTIDISTKKETIYPFLSKKDTRDNFNSWLECQTLRLPKTFIVKSEEFTRNFIGPEIKALGLPLPSKSNLKEYVVYHKTESGYVHMNIENFTNSILPVLEGKFFRRLLAQGHTITNRLDDIEDYKGLYGDVLL